jgi:VanZ family protein
LLLYALLLIFTPFIMLRAFLQDAVGRASASKIPLGSLEVPIVPLVAGLLVVLALVRFRPRFTRRRALTALLALVLIAVAQRSTDVYFGHNFYDLQQNWHYLAYSIFAFMVYRDLHPRGVPLARIVLVAFGLAAACSAFDEGFQMFLSSRVFDMSDIAKDVWGTLIGLGVLLLGFERTDLPVSAWRKLRPRRLGDYLRSAPSLWILLLGLGFIFLGASSLLTEPRYWGHVILFTLSAFSCVFLLFHWSRHRVVGRVFLGAGIAVVLALSGNYLRHRHDNIVSFRYGLVDYRGLPLPFFDVMIWPDGSFRLVDKKHFFNNRDRIFLNRQKADILLIGAGNQKLGGKGFSHAEGSRFIYNPFTRDATQVIILPSDEACRRFNRLKEQGKNVLFILHTTC